MLGNRPLYSTPSLILFLLVACSEPAKTVQPTDLEQIDPCSQDVVFWYHHTLAREELFTRMIAEFNGANAHGIQVRGEYAGNYPNLFNKMIVGIQAGMLPAMSVAYNNQAISYYENEAIVDLQPYIDSAKWGLDDDDLNDFYPAFLEQDRSGKIQVAFPPNRSLELLYYNQEWLRELGLESAPRDWRGFENACHLAAARPFSRATVDGAPVGLLIDADASRLASMIFGRGGDFMNSSRDRYTLNTPQVASSLQLLWRLVDAKAATLITEPGQGLYEFCSGQAAFYVATSTSIPLVDSGLSESAAPFSWGVAPLPYVGDHPSVNVYGASIVICRTTPEQQLAAWLFLKWLTETEQQARWVEVSGYFPARRSTEGLLAGYFERNPQYRNGFELLQYGKPEPGVGGYERVRRLIAETMVAAMLGEDLDELLPTLESEANATLKRQALRTAATDL